MRLKKVLSIVLSVLMVFGLNLNIFAYADDSTTISLNDASIKAGENASLTLQLTNNPGFAALAVTMYYNPEYLTLSSLEAGDLSGALVVPSPNANSDREGLKAAKLAVTNMADMTGDKTLATLNFKAADDLEGSVESEVIVDVTRFTKADRTDLKPSTTSVSGTVTIQGSAPTIGTVTVDPAEVTVDGTNAQTADVTVESVKGTAMNASDVSWAVTYNGAATTDVTVGTDGKVNVAAQAKAGTYTLTANEVADKSKGSASATLAVKHADSVLKTLEPASTNVKVDGTKADPASVALTAKDQFGDAMTSGVTYEVAPADQGVSVSGSNVAVDKMAKPGTYTVTAKAGDNTATAEVKISRSGAKATTLTVSEGQEVILVPASGSNPNSSAAFKPEVKDQYGDPMNDAPVEWSIDAINGVSVADGVVTVTDAAKEAITDTTGKQLTVTAKSGDATGTAKITVKRDAPAAASVEIQKEGAKVEESDTITKPVESAPDKTVTYTAKVLDQYGTEMKDASVTWTNDVSVTGVTVANNAVTVTSKAEKGTAGKLTAAVSDTVKADVTINISDLEVNWSAVSAKDVEYGTTNKDAVSAPASGTASDGTNTINGTFTVQNADAVPAVGPATVTVDFTVTDAGDYKDLTVSKDYTFNVTPKALTVTAGDYAAVKDYDGTTEVKNPSGALALEGIVGQDDVSVVIGTTGTYSDANAGENKSIELSGLALTGAAAGNYTLKDSAYTFTNGKINKIAPTVELLKVEGVPADLPYEGKEHPATVTAVEGVQGLGDITVKYSKDGAEAVTEAPVEEGTYSVKAEVAEGTNYTAAEFQLGNIKITKTEVDIDKDVKTDIENKTGDSSVDDAVQGETKVETDNLLDNEKVKETLEDQARESEAENQDKIQQALPDQEYKLDVELNVNLSVNQYSTAADNAYVKMSITLSMTVKAKSTAGSEEVTLEENKPVDSTEIKQAVNVQLQLPQGFPTEDLFVDIAQSSTIKTLRPTITKLTSEISAGLMDDENPEKTGDGAEATDTYVATWEQSEFGEDVETTLYQDSSKIAVTFKYDNGDTETVFYNQNDSDDTELTQIDETKEGSEFQNWKAEDSGTAVATVGDIRKLLTEDQKEITLVSVFKTSGTGGGGGASPATYAVTAPADVENGTVATNVEKAKKGDTVTITPTPAEGYKTEAVTVKDKDGKDVEVKDNGDGTYSFTMPASKVTIDASFVEDKPSVDPKPHDPCPSEPYTDVDTSLWYHEGIDYVIANGIMNGISENQFAPDMTTTRAMIVTILHRLDGAAEVDTTSTFKDVEANSWYEAAVNWAAANEIVKGYNEDTFGPDDVITREQMATILYRYAQYKGLEDLKFADLSSFADSSQISDYAGDAMAWAVEAGIIQGMTDTTLVPQGSATRAQIATLIMRVCENVLQNTNQEA